MINAGKFSILGIRIDAVDYEYAVAAIASAAESKESLAVSALAVHGVMTGFLDSVHARRLNGLDLVVPDGQPVRWALNWLHGVSLPDRVYGPDLTLLTAAELAKRGMGVYLYGSTAQVLEKFAAQLRSRCQGLTISGMEPSKFRRLDPGERDALITRIKHSGARAVFVGLGCPRQEVWAFEYREVLPMPVLAVGAAFDFHAGTLPQAPKSFQDMGLEWLFRLWQEPSRLWRRYLLLNPLYLWKLAAQKTNPAKFPVLLPDGTEGSESFG